MTFGNGIAIREERIKADGLGFRETNDKEHQLSIFPRKGTMLMEKGRKSQGIFHVLLPYPRPSQPNSNLNSQKKLNGTHEGVVATVSTQLW